MLAGEPPPLDRRLGELPEGFAQLAESPNVHRTRSDFLVVEVEDHRQPEAGVLCVMDELRRLPAPDAAGVDEVEARPTGPKAAGGSRLHPGGLPKNRAFAPGVSVDGPARTIYVGGQNGIRADGTIVGDDLAAQTRQALENVGRVLAEAGAELTDIVYWRIAVVHGASLAAGFTAFQEVWGARGEPPAISVDVVAGLANPAFLVEITAVAVLAGS